MKHFWRFYAILTIDVMVLFVWNIPTQNSYRTRLARFIMYTADALAALLCQENFKCWGAINKFRSTIKVMCIEMKRLWISDTTAFFFWIYWAVLKIPKLTEKYEYESSVSSFARKYWFLFFMFTCVKLKIKWFEPFIMTVHGQYRIKISCAKYNFVIFVPICSGNVAYVILEVL